MTGVITAALGAHRYVELAVSLALSIRACSELPVALVTDAAGAVMVSSRYAGIFDSVIALPENVIGAGSKRFLEAKCYAMELSPYEFSIFLDSDVYCLRDPGCMAENLDANEFRACHRLYDVNSVGTLVHNGLQVAQIFKKLQIESYLHCFLCCFAFGKAGGKRVARILREVDNRWREQMLKEFGDVLFDEVALGLAGSEACVSHFANPTALYQKQGPDFRFTDDFVFVHAAPMRLVELGRLLFKVAQTRIRYGYSPTPVIHWLAIVLRRIRDELGRYRRVYKLVEKIG